MEMMSNSTTTDDPSDLTTTSAAPSTTATTTADQDPEWRRSARIPGGLGINDQLSPMKEFEEGGTEEPPTTTATQDEGVDGGSSHHERTTKWGDHGAKTGENENESAIRPPSIASTARNFHPDYSEHEAASEQDEQDSGSLLPPLSDADADEGFTYADPDIHANQTGVDEKEMRRKLMDMESSFLPEFSPAVGKTANSHGVGADDTYLVGVTDANPAATDATPSKRHPRLEGDSVIEEEPTTPPGRQEAEPQDKLESTPQANGREPNTSSLESIRSSPPATATASQFRSGQNPTLWEPVDASADGTVDATPRLSRSRGRIPSNPPSEKLFQEPGGDDDNPNTLSSSSLTSSDRRRKRPKFLTSRQSSHRFSNSSITSGNTDTASDATAGADYALQSGGAVPASRSNRRDGPGLDLTRSVSLGSLASGVSGLSDDHMIEKRTFSNATDSGLQTLDEEEVSSQPHPKSSQASGNADDLASAPMTPRARPARDATVPADTVIAERAQDIEVPGTFARQFRESNQARGLSPDKRSAVPPTPSFGRSGRTMTLKEQSSTIDRLSKENFDLKMRIHFLNEALNKRSEEGIREMISENVELKSDKLKLQKDNQSLKRAIRDLERKLKDREQGGESGKDDKESESESGRAGVDEEEFLYLRERIETYEAEIDRLRSESIIRESEKRRLAEMVKSLGEGRPVGSDVGAREERDMWKDMLDAETAAREQAEEENRRLRDEMLHMRSGMIAGSSGLTRSVRGGRSSFAMSQSGGSDRDITDRTAGLGSSSSSTLVELELLKQENAELRREVSAQTSMLTSRNREKERLYQEIEDLKLGQRRDGGRSVAGDSIFERSVSRAHARSVSRASDGTRASRLSDAERETFENKNGELRDQVSTLKLENQTLREQVEEYVSELQAFERAYQEDIEQAEADLQSMQMERDQALQLADEREAELQDLKAEAQEEIDALGEELDEKLEECQRHESDLRNQDDNLKALQAEMRSASEGIIRLEEDAQNNLQKYRSVQQELDDANRELESLEKNLFEANSKVQRLTVQQESSQNEISFLREEQDGDKIKIGDLESELKTTQMSLQSEKERSREFDRRLHEERHQREVVGSKEKQEVQRIMNELNRESTAAKEEARKLKKSLSSREIEAATWKERLMELENNLRETLGDLSGTRSSLLNSITKLQKELESTTLELENIRTKLDEKESLLRNRDSLLETHGLESRKLAELLERERQARRADKHSFEQALKSHQIASRTISQNNSRISDLEVARSQERKRFGSLEQQLKDQLSERNAMFLQLWKRLSAMCGPDWAHSNSLINGNLPSQEVIGNMLFWPGFSKNLFLAVKTAEQLVAGFKGRVKAVERDLTKEYQALEHTLSLRVKKLDRLEESVMSMRRSAAAMPASPEISKLRAENRLLKAELNLLQSHSRARASAPSDSPDKRAGKQIAKHAASNAMSSSLIRHNSSDSNAVDGAPGIPQVERNTSIASRSSGIPQLSNFSSSTTLNANRAGGGALSQSSNHTSQAPGSGEPSQEKWIQRLRELERRLKAEREARLLDRSGARKRLEERSAENEELRAQLERERSRRITSGSVASSLNPAAERADGHDNRRRSAYNDSDDGTGTGTDDGEGLCVEVEM